jgi:hypothetical protein
VVPRLALVIYLLFSCAVTSARALPDAKDGDIIFQTSKSSQSLAIQRATHSKYSHMGIIFLRGDKPFVFEASATVRYTPLAEWIARGKGGEFVLKRLRTELTKSQIGRLRKVAGNLAGRPYDLTFEWSDSRIYCSELVWKIYDRALDIQIGKLQVLRDFDLSDPSVRAKMKERYGNAVPLDEKVISPAAMFAAPSLAPVLGAGT